MERESLFQFLYRFLLESDYPVVLQVFWKLLTWSMTALIAAEVIPHVQSLGGQVLLSILATAFFVGGLFTKLGDE
jgi:hypothetical protein